MQPLDNSSDDISVEYLEWPTIGLPEEVVPEPVPASAYREDTPAELIEKIRAEFPHVAVRLSALWGSPEFDVLLQGLLIADRPNRQGFPKPIVSYLLKLSILHPTPKDSPCTP